MTENTNRSDDAREISRLLHTAHVPAGEGPFPTLIALHGWGASAHDLFGLAPLLGGDRALVLCPQGPVTVPVGPGMTGYGWFPLVPGQPVDREAVLSAAESLRAFLDAARERYPVDPERVVLLGFSQGGMMAFEQLLRHPERFVGLVGLSTRLPKELTDELPPASDHADKPVLLLHGTEDQMIPVDAARESRELLRPYDVRLQYRELPMGHEINREALELLVEWLGKRGW